jgi:hypothetical protein
MTPSHLDTRQKYTKKMVLMNAIEAAHLNIRLMGKDLSSLEDYWGLSASFLGF